MAISGDNASRGALLRLMDEKVELERKIEDLGRVLQANGIGMSEPLVDQDGFPRNDIDVVTVRHARHDIICLQTERRALMGQIERGLNDYHQRNEPMQLADYSNANGHHHQPMDVDVPRTRSTEAPFARVGSVVPGQGADQAGLQAGDQILQIGTLSARNFRSLTQIQTIMVNSAGQAVRLLVRKPGSGDEVTINVTPPNLGINFEVATMNGH